MDRIHDILKEYWGYDSFRPLQADIIRSVLDGHDTLGLLPTGGGKSITFQVPALALGGLTLVVTPLISLMKDQTDRLVGRGIRAATVHKDMTYQQVLDTYERVIAEDYRFLYLSPERLETQLFLAKLQYMDVRLLVVDEAHCISQWGYDFRPAYMHVAEVRRRLPPSTPCMALTATATAATIDDIRRRLGFRPGAQTFRASFARPNLTYSVLPTEDKAGLLCRLLDGVGCAIVYVRSRAKTREVSDMLTARGIAATFYHAGLTSVDKQSRQDAWMAGQVAVIVATNAFGMGIDKPDVRLVAHLEPPPSPEDYFQEAGRAGRDGLPAQAVLLTSRSDASRLRRHLADEYPDRDYIRSVYQRLASFYQIAIGAAAGCLFEFDLMRFCTAYRLAAAPAHYALRLLDLAGYISYIEDPELHSRLMFITSRESLYHLNQFDAECQRIITALLRLYTGLFADYVFIREEDVMKRTGLDRETLYQKLLLLTRHRVLHYIPARQMPAVVYRTPRLDNDEIRIPHTIFEQRYQRQSERLEAMIAYVGEGSECRLVRLLRYFGEEAEPCGHCDVCRSAAAARIPHDEASAIRQAALRLLQSSRTDDGSSPAPIPVHALIARLYPHEAERASNVLRQMIDDREVLLLQGTLLCLPH